MKIELDLKNYPSLQQLFDQDKEQFGALLKGILVHANEAVASNRIKDSQEIYNLPYMLMVDEVMQAFFEPEGIADYHYNKQERNSLRALRFDLHPLAIFTNNAVAYNAQGEVVTPGEWLDMRDENFSIKNWLYKLFYGARFVSWQELSEYLSLGKYDLVEALKLANYKQLASIQPALRFQEQQGIPKGKILPGLGLLDGGDETTKLHHVCPACEQNTWDMTNETYAYCTSCGLGGLK